MSVLRIVCNLIGVCSIRPPCFATQESYLGPNGTDDDNVYNRISAANLQRVAELLKVPVESFYDGPAAILAPPPLTVEQAWAEHRAATKALEDALQREAAALQVAA